MVANYDKERFSYFYEKYCRRAVKDGHATAKLLLSIRLPFALSKHKEMIA